MQGDYSDLNLSLKEGVKKSREWREEERKEGVFLIRGLFLWLSSFCPTLICRRQHEKARSDFEWLVGCVCLLLRLLYIFYLDMSGWSSVQYLSFRQVAEIGSWGHRVEHSCLKPGFDQVDSGLSSQ